MPEFQFTGSKGLVQSQPFQYRSQPNSQASRIAQSLQQTILGGMQLTQQIRQDNFNQAALEQREAIAKHKEAWAGLSYKERKDYLPQIQADLIDKYKGDSKLVQQLHTRGTEAFSSFGSQLQAQGVKEEYLDNLTMQNKGLVEMKKAWAAAKDTEEKAQIIQQIEDSYVKPYEGYDDEYSRKLYENGLNTKADFELTLTKERTAINDQDVLTSVLDATATTIDVNGSISKGEYTDLIDKLKGVSDFETNKSKYLSSLGRQVLYSIVNTANQAPKTWENAENFRNKLTEFAKVDPKVKNTDTYKASINSVKAFENIANTRDKSSLDALVSNDWEKIGAVKELGSKLVQRGAITQDEYENFVFLKTKKNVTKNVKMNAASMYIDENWEGLRQFIREGKGGSVASVINGNLTTEFAVMEQQNKGAEALDSVLSKAARASQELGIAIDKIAPIDNYLDMPSNGGLTTNEDVSRFVTAMDFAKKHNYFSDAKKRNLGDYQVLKVWQKMGVPDIADYYKNFKTNPVTVDRVDTKVTEILDALLDQNEWLSEDTKDTNYAQFKKALGFSIKAGLKAGIDPDDMKEGWEDSLEALFFEVDSNNWEGQGNLHLPRVDGISTEQSYTRVRDIFGGKAIVQPLEPLNGEGYWMVINEEGQAQVFEYEFMKYLSTSESISNKPALTRGSYFAKKANLNEAQEDLLQQFFKSNYSYTDAFKQELINSRVTTEEQLNIKFKAQQEPYKDYVFGQYLSRNKQLQSQFENPKLMYQMLNANTIDSKNLKVSRAKDRQATNVLLNYNTSPKIKKLQEQLMLEPTGVIDSKLETAVANYLTAFGEDSLNK